MGDSMAFAKWFKISRDTGEKAWLQGQSKSNLENGYSQTAVNVAEAGLDLSRTCCAYAHVHVGLRTIHLYWTKDAIISYRPAVKLLYI